MPGYVFWLASVLLLLLTIALYAYRRAEQPKRQFYQEADPPVVGDRAQVVAYHPQARQAGLSILEAGGNAFDAFVATVLAENVLAEGGSSLAGPMAALLYRASDGQLIYLDADFNDPIDPDGRGQPILVPGAPAALEMIASNYGTLPLAALVEPALALARDGFPVTRLMSSFIAWRADQLKSTSYGRRTYFSGRRALRPGETLALPEVASFLASFAQEGAAYVYSGEWGRRFLSAANSRGARLKAEDLANYSVTLHEPWRAEYRGHVIYSSSANSFSGPWTLLALKAWEHSGEPAAHHYSEDPDALELLIRVARQTWSESFLLNYQALGDREAVQSRLTAEYAKAIWERAVAREPANPMAIAGSHSYAIVTTDRAGNIVCGTTTIQSEPWGDGQFVQGVPLTTAGAVPWHTEPGQRRLSPFSIHLAFKQDAPRFAVSAISNSVGEAAFQFFVDLIDRNMSVTEAVEAPRFGTFPSGSDRSLSLDRNWLDPRIAQPIVLSLRDQGIEVTQSGDIDTGLGALLAVGPDLSSSQGAVVPVPYVPAPFSSK